MDLFAKQEKIFRQINEEMTHFITAIGVVLRSPAQKVDSEQAQRSLDQVLKSANQIGGKIAQDVESLRRDFHRFLAKPDSLETKKMIEDALRIKHEVRGI
jgi:hypothetical protein